jgi:5-methylcytosine-specific restriction endonuclease McrA
MERVMATDEHITFKACSKCKATLPAADFRVDTQKASGLYPSCRVCCRKREAARYAADLPTWRAKGKAQRYLNPIATKANEDRYRANNPERLKERKQQYYERAKLRPEIQAKWKDYRESHTEETKVRCEKWRTENPERHLFNALASVHRRRSLTKSGVSGPDLRAWVIAAVKVCYWCGIKCRKSFHMDHYMPLSKGGAHDLSNLVIACPNCNQRKHAKDPFDFALTVGRLL